MNLHKNANAKKYDFGKFSIKFYGQKSPSSLLVSAANSSYQNISSKIDVGNPHVKILITRIPFKITGLCPQKFTEQQ